MGALARVALVALACVARARGVASDLAVRDFAAVGDAWRFQGAASNASTSDAVSTEVLRITPARANAAGSAFAATKQLVVGGFVADFAFTVASPPDVEIPCEGVDHQPATCSRRCPPL